jgi:hypothetical protein
VETTGITRSVFREDSEFLRCHILREPKKEHPASLEEEIANLSIEEDEVSDLEEPDDKPLLTKIMDTKNKRTTVDVQPDPTQKLQAQVSLFLVLIETDCALKTHHYF